MLGDHVAEHLERAAIDPHRRGQSEEGLRGPVVGGAIGANRQGAGAAEDIRLIADHTQFSSEADYRQKEQAVRRKTPTCRLMTMCFSSK